MLKHIKPLGSLDGSLWFPMVHCANKRSTMGLLKPPGLILSGLGFLEEVAIRHGHGLAWRTMGPDRCCERGALEWPVRESGRIVH